MLQWGKPPEKTVLDIIGSKNAQSRSSCGPSGRGTIENGVVRCCVVQTGEIFTGDENNDRLATMHTSDHHRLVWYEISDIRVNDRFSATMCSDGFSLRYVGV